MGRAVQNQPYQASFNAAVQEVNSLPMQMVQHCGVAAATCYQDSAVLAYASTYSAGKLCDGTQG